MARPGFERKDTQDSREAHFAGRVEAIGRFRQLLDTVSPPVWALHGTGGIGRRTMPAWRSCGSWARSLARTSSRVSSMIVSSFWRRMVDGVKARASASFGARDARLGLEFRGGGWIWAA